MGTVRVPGRADRLRSRTTRDRVARDNRRRVRPASNAWPQDTRCGPGASVGASRLSNEPRSPRMEPVLSRDPRTGDVRAQVGVEADTAAVDVAVRAAYTTLDALADRQ